MVSISITVVQSYAHIPHAHNNSIPAVTNLIAPSSNLALNPPKGLSNYKKATKRRFIFVDVDKACDSNSRIDGSMCCSCKNSEEDAELEAEILEYMSKSDKPTMFPTREELLRSGKLDLVEAIKKRGGWYSLGWDNEDDDKAIHGEAKLDLDVREFDKRVEGCREGAVLRKQYDDFLDKCGEDDGFIPEVNGSAETLDSLESDSDEESGIKGILTRLEKQRNSDFGINLEKGGHELHPKSKDGADVRYFESFSGALNSSNGKFGPKTKPENWRNWSNHRAGFQEKEFEAAEIYFPKSGLEHNRKTYIDETVCTEESVGSLDRLEDINHGQIRARLQHLELELNSALHSLKSKRDEKTLTEVSKSPDDFHKLSDAWEFQENEIMGAHERLRSIRAKLAVIEGKMALAIIDAQKVAEGKQKRIDNARKALQLLRTTCVVWPNSASEVFLAGSFDGWTTQRKMEKSKTGIFSVSLKLYPGKYEIKFIVDGIWKIDPLRPLVYNNGYENNLLIVT